MRINDRIRRWKFSRKGRLPCLIFNLTRGIRGGLWLRYDSRREVYHADIPGHGARIYLSRPHQAWRMRHGAIARLEQLARMYSLDTVEVADRDVVVDAGANIGELGMYYALVRGRDVNYFALEPVDKEVQCCRLNNPGKTVLQQALWKENGRVRFYRSTAYNDDSSVIEPPHYESAADISAVTVEKFANRHGIDKIKTLKVETEGAEPEVLMGAEKILHRIEYVAADLGPERGPEEKSTFPMVVDFLYSRGFKLASEYGYYRRNFLFRNHSPACR